jgi:hypothetical protein
MPINIPAVSPTSTTHLHTSNYTNSNANSHNIYWHPVNSNTSKSSQIYFNQDSNLSRQFSKQIEIKNTIHQPVLTQPNNFKKTSNNVIFQSSPKEDQITLPTHPVYKAPSISMSVKPTSTQPDPKQLTQSYHNTTKVSQSFETPKFNYYQSPYSSADMKNSVGSFQIQPSVSNSLTSQPNFNFVPLPNNDSPTKSSNSPILTKSIISPEPVLGGAYLQPKVSA